MVQSRNDVLSPYLLSGYMRELLCSIVNSTAGCNIWGYMINILAHAGDNVLIAPSWKALQYLLDILNNKSSRRYAALWLDVRP